MGSYRYFLRVSQSRTDSVRGSMLREKKVLDLCYHWNCQVLQILKFHAEDPTALQKANFEYAAVYCAS